VESTQNPYTTKEAQESQFYDRENLLRLTNGNELAADFIGLGRVYAHLMDDIIDEQLSRQESNRMVLRMGAMALELYSHPFYQRNVSALFPVMIRSQSAYLDSCEWEKEDGWKKAYSDWARHSWLEVVLMTAYICGGWEHMRKFEPAARLASYALHHDEKGRPV
jgi:hypothetical protein